MEVECKLYTVKYFQDGMHKLGDGALRLTERYGKFLKVRQRSHTPSWFISHYRWHWGFWWLPCTRFIEAICCGGDKAITEADINFLGSLCCFRGRIFDAITVWSCSCGGQPIGIKMAEYHGWIPSYLDLVSLWAMMRYFKLIMSLFFLLVVHSFNARLTHCISI